MAAFTTYYPIKKSVAPIKLLVDYTARGPYFTFENPQMFAYSDPQRLGVRNVWQAILTELAAVSQVHFRDNQLFLMFMAALDQNKKSMLLPFFVGPPVDFGGGKFDSVTEKIVEMGRMLRVQFVPELDKSKWYSSYSDIRINRAKQDIISGLKDLHAAFTVQNSTDEAATLNSIVLMVETRDSAPIGLGMTALFFYARHRSAKFSRDAEAFGARGLRSLREGVIGLRRFNPMSDIKLPEAFRGIRRRYAR